MKKLIVDFPEFKQTMKMYVLNLAHDWDECDLCEDLEEHRKQVVHGSGNPNADLLILGDKPGPDEDLEGVPFIGDSGGILNSLLVGESMTREDVFVDNLISCMPTHIVDKRQAVRSPTQVEVTNCLPRMHEVIRTIDPLLILAMGKSVLQSLTGLKTLTITKARGEVFIVRVPGVFKMIEYPIVASRHPSYVLRNPSNSKNGPKWQLLHDFEFAIKLLKLTRKCYQR